MNDEQKAALVDIRDSLRHLSELANVALQPIKGVLQAQIFILVQKVRYLLGEEDTE